jgi:hypothetical protein
MSYIPDYPRIILIALGTFVALVAIIIAGQLMSHGLSYALRPSADGWDEKARRPVMVTKPPIDSLQFPDGSKYDLTGPPGIYECSHEQGCWLLYTAMPQQPGCYTTEPRYTATGGSVKIICPHGETVK